MKRLYVLAILALLVVSLGGCGGASLTSRSKDREITIDGKLADWSGALQFVEKKGLSFAVMNDETHVYVVVAATDELVKEQIMASGLYLWFDEKETKEKDFGVCFPIGGLENRGAETRPHGTVGEGLEGGSMRPARPGGYGGPDGLGASSPPPPGPMGPPSSTSADSVGGPGRMSGSGPTAPPGPLSGKGPMAPREMMVYSVKTDAWEQGKGSLGGVDVAADFGRKVLVLEMRIPLARDPSSGYGIGALPGHTIGVGVESPQIEGGPEGESVPPLGQGGGPGGGEPGGPGGGGGEQRQRPEAIKVWAKLTLAGKGTT